MVVISRNATFQKYCNLSCCKSASKQNSDFMKNAQNNVNCEVKPNFGKKQLEPKSSPIAFSIGFSQSSHTLHVLYQKKTFVWKAIKHPVKMQSKPFFGEPQALQKITLETHFSLQTTRKGKVGTFAPLLF